MSGGFLFQVPPLVAITLGRAVKWDSPYNATLPRHLHCVTGPTCLVVFLQFIQNLDGVFASGPIIEQEYAVLVIEMICVADGEAVTGHAVSAHSLIFRSCALMPTRPLT